jgi:hypothetical protein
VDEQHTKASLEGAAAGAVTGGVTSGIFGWLAGIGTLVIPGAGSLIAASPVLGALGVAAAGSAVGAMAGALVGFGIAESEVNPDEAKLENSTPISVDARVDTADSLERNGATHVCIWCKDARRGIFSRARMPMTFHAPVSSASNHRQVRSS